MKNEIDHLLLMINGHKTIKEFVEFEILGQIEYRENSYPINCFTIGSKEENTPILLITGGIHGIERIGTQLAYSFLKNILERIPWDKSYREVLSKIKIIIIPLVNPVGFEHFKRSNGNNVDLMRNSPIHAVERTPFLVGGQTYSQYLPWFRGDLSEMEKETKLLFQKFSSLSEQSKCVVAVDLHSGFGMRDRVWFPYSYTSKPFPDLVNLYSLFKIFESTHPYHIYKIEPQSKSYLIHGDFWDFAYLKYKEKNRDGIFLPLTLEMGSWMWVRKNPLQLFSRLGIFNPIVEHRFKRTLRRHAIFLDFLIKALYSHEVWCEMSDDEKLINLKNAEANWYE
jgi:Zinc carboxypeptidase